MVIEMKNPETTSESIRKLRTKTLPALLGTKVSQPRFARIISEVATRLYGVDTPCSTRAVQDWEYEKTNPSKTYIGAIIQIIESCERGDLTRLPGSVYYDRDFYAYLDRIVNELSGKVVEKS